MNKATANIKHTWHIYLKSGHRGGNYKLYLWGYLKIKGLPIRARFVYELMDKTNKTINLIT